MSTDHPTYPMTAEALDALRAELKHKEEVEKPALAVRLKAAIEMGDLSENADYAAAKEDQSFLQGRIDELKQMIRWATIIEEKVGSYDSVELGCHVTVLEEGEGEPETFRLVGKVEANPREGRISDESPLGRALLHHKVGDTVRVDAPDGDLVFKIVEIE
ncbi:MAG: transcription elongation factor GreA [Chloroflexota bacterium]